MFVLSWYGVSSSGYRCCARIPTEEYGFSHQARSSYYALNHPKQVEFDKGVMEFIVKDLQPLSALSGRGFRSLVHSLDAHLAVHPPLFYLSTWHDEVNAFVRAKIREHRDAMVAAAFNT